MKKMFLIFLLFLSGCASLGTLTSKVNSTSQPDMSAAPLGTQAEENYWEAHQSPYLFKFSHTIRF